MKAFVEKYEQNAEGKIGIIEVRKLRYGIKIRYFFYWPNAWHKQFCLAGTNRSV